MKKKNAFTLLEIMIVIFLIGLIGSIIGYNMKGSLDEGKAFKTEQAQLRISDLLDLEIAKGADPEKVIEDPRDYLKASGIVKNVGKLMKDGWGELFVIELDGQGNVIARSEKLDLFNEKKAALRGNEELSD